MKCQDKISLSQEVKFTGHLEEKIENYNVELTDNFDSSFSNDWLWNFYFSDVTESSKVFFKKESFLLVMGAQRTKFKTSNL